MSDEIIHLTSCCGNLFVTFSSGKTRAGVRAGPSSPTPTTQTLPIISIRTGRRRVVLATPVTTAPPRPAACTPARPLPHSLSCPRPCILDYASDCFFLDFSFLYVVHFYLSSFSSFSLLVMDFQHRSLHLFWVRLRLLSRFDPCLRLCQDEENAATENPR